MATLNEIVAALAKENATRIETTIETVTPEVHGAVTQLRCSLADEVDYVDREGNDAKTNIFYTSNIDLNIAVGKMPAKLAAFAGIIRNDRSGSFGMFLLAGSKVTIYQERLEAGVPYTDRMTGKEYTPKTDQFYAYIVDIKLAADNTILEDTRREAMRTALAFGGFGA